MNQGYAALNILQFNVVKDGDDRFKLTPGQGSPADAKELVFTCDDEMQRNVWITRLTQQ